MNGEQKSSLIRSLQDDKGDVIQLCSKLISLGGENPPGDTAKVADHIQEMLNARGFTVKRFEPKRNVVSLLSRIGASSSKNLVLCGHLDVFPAGGPWKDPPFSGRVSGGRIMGRGAVDMKAGVAASLTAFQYLSRLERSLDCGVTLALFSDEESMGFHGAQWMLKNVPESRGDACLIGEPAGVDTMTIGEKGVWWIKLVAEGEFAHGAYTKGRNAIISLVDALRATESMKTRASKAPQGIAKVIDGQEAFLRRELKITNTDAVDHVWVNAGVIAGGEKVNLVPRRCEAQLDFRLPFGTTVEESESRLTRLLRDRKLANVSFETIFSMDPNFTGPNEEIVRLTARNIREFVKVKPGMAIRLGSTDGKFYRRLGVPTVTYGPSARLMGHTGEFVESGELLHTAKVHLGVAYDYAAAG